MVVLKSSLVVLASAVLLIGCSSGPTPSTEPERATIAPTRAQMESTVQEQLNLMLVAFAPVAGQILPNEKVLSFYQRREFQPLWLQEQQINPALLELIRQLAAADMQGLNPLHYHLPALRDYVQIDSPTLQQLAELDVLATTALQSYARDLNIGRFDPRTIDPNWQLDAPSDAWQNLLELPDAAAMVAELPNLAPNHADYQILQRWYVYYRDLAKREDEIVVPRGNLLLRGERSPRVALLRARLIQLGDLRPAARRAENDVYDEEVEQAVMNFQRRHQLVPDGRTGSQTLAAMNVPAWERAEQIRYNLERWRWLPSTLENDRIWVDLADYQVHIFLDGQHTSMRAVIGQPDRKTPVFRGNMTYFEVNPTWRVPHRLAVEMILPIVQMDPSYLRRNNYRVYNGWHSGALEVDPSSVDWRNLDHTTMRYRFEQQPDEGNAMGQYKFMFPNRNAIYLHDTPEQRHFALRERAYSAGCVRIEDPDLLADLLVGTGRNQRHLANARNTEDTSVIGLDVSVPIYLVYFTVAPDATGMPTFRDDVYDRDVLMREAMGNL
ncbi:murein L,D-transpeptidase [Salinispirillum marinum]|uniref:Murein L,D-transpeptidase n=2 Tax=Saccharospirillaceae TaxID=255527 RepID=A0ABV8BC59_9GAMM